MALNFLGLGFSLGAEDKGLSKAIKDTSLGLADIGKSVVGIGLASAKMVFRPPNFKPAIGAVNMLASDVKVTTNMIDQFGAASSKATSAGLAGLNLTEKQFKEAQGTISSTAFSMNTDVGAVTRSMVALKQASVDVKKVGFKSFKEYQKFIEVTGTDSVKFASAIGKMNHQMGMTPEMTEDVIKSVTAIGKKFNIGREAIAGMSDTVEMLNENANLLPQNWSPEKMSKFIKGTTIVAGALTKVGFTADEAIGASKGLAQALLKGQAGMAALYSGLEDDIPGITDVLTQNLGSIDQAVKKLQESPDDFIAGLGKMVDDVNKMNLDPDSLNRFRIQMEKQFGPAAMAVFTKKGFGQIAPAIKEAQKPIEDQGNILTKTAGKYRDGRVAADHFAIAQAQLAEKMKHVKGVMSDTEFLGKYKKGTDDVIVNLNRFAGKGGVVGKATQMMVNFHNHGIGGTLGAMHPLGLMSLELVKQFGPILQMLPVLTGAFKALASPIVLVAGLIAGLAYVFKDLAKGENSVVRPFIEKMIKEAPVFFEKIKDTFVQAVEVIGKVLKQVDWGAVGKYIYDGFETVFYGIFAVIEMINWSKVADILGQGLVKAFDLALIFVGKALDLLGRLLAWFVQLDWQAIGHWIGGAFVKLAAFALDGFFKILVKLPELAVGLFIMVVKAIVGILDGIEDALSKKFPRLAGFFTAFFTGLKVVAIVVLSALVVHFGFVLAAGIASAVGVIAAWAVVLAPIVAIIAVLGLIGLAFKKLYDKIVENWTPIKEFFSDVWDAISSAASAVWGAIKYVVTSPIEAIKKLWGYITGFFGRLWDGIKSVASSIWEGIKKVVLSPIEAVKAAWGAIKGFFGDIWDGIKGAASSAWSWIKDKATGAWDGITGAVSGGKLSGAIQKELDSVKTKTDQLSKDTAKSAQDALTSVKGTSVGVKVVAVDSAQTASTATVDANVKTAKMVQDYVDNTDKHLKKAASLIFPRISGDPMNEVTQKYRDSYNQIEAINLQIANLHADNATQATDAQGKILQGVYNIDKATASSVDKLEDKIKDIRAEMAGQDQEAIKQFGISAQVMDGTVHGTRQQFAALSEGMDKMRIEDRDAMQERVNSAASYYAKEELNLQRKIQLTKMANQDASEYEKQFAAIQTERDTELKALGTEISAYSSATKGVIADWGKATKAEIDATTKMMIDKFTVSSTEMAKRWSASGPAGQEIARGFQEIDKGYASAILNLKTQSGLTGDALKKEIDAVTAKYGAQRKILSDEVLKYGSDLRSANKTVQDAVADTLKGTIDKIQDNLKKGNKAVADSAKIVSQEFKLSGAEAADAVGKIAVIDPVAFRTNIRVVRTETMSFLQKLDVEAQKLVKDTDKAINAFWEHSKKGWNDQEALIKSFSEKAAVHIQTYWTKAIDEAGRAVTAFVTLSKNIDAGLKAMAKSINLMDLLASPSQITAWAAAVVSALANAFRGGAAADAMIAAAYTKALTEASEIAHQADAARPDAGGATTPRNTSSAMQATLSLERSINHPAWASDKDEPIPATLNLMNENLTNLLAAMTAFANGKPVTPPRATPPKVK